MEVIIFNMTLTCTLVIAFNLYVLDASDSFNVDMLNASLDLLVIVALTFAYFYPSEQFTTNLLEIGDIFYDSTWYKQLTAKQQILIILAMQRAQREIRLTGLGLFNCSLPIFQAVRITSEIQSSSYNYFFNLFK